MDDRPIPYLLKIIVDKIKVGADAHLKSHNLTLSQSRVLAFTVSKGGTATQKEIEDYLHVSHPTVVGLVTRMEANGILSSYYERTGKVVTLTEKAAEVGKDMVETMERNDAVLLKGLSKGEIAELERLLLIVYKNVT